MYLVGNADEWWGHYWKAFVTGKDKNRINVSHRQLLLKITACSLSQKLGGTMELSYGNRKDQYDKTRLLLCAGFLRVKFPSLHHTLLLPPQDQEKGSLRGSKGLCTRSSPPWQPKAGVTWWVLAAAAREWDSRLLPKAPLASGSLWDVQCTSPLPHHPTTPRSCLAGLWLPVSALQTVK